jgi:thiamine biosynthesis protein ThiS
MSTNPTSTNATAAINMLTISVNGESRATKLGATVVDLLRELGLDHGRVAIERNLEILPRDQWPATQIQPNDRYEIVHFVGGG